MRGPRVQSPPRSPRIARKSARFVPLRFQTGRLTHLDASLPQRRGGLHRSKELSRKRKRRSFHELSARLVIVIGAALFFDDFNSATLGAPQIQTSPTDTTMVDQAVQRYEKMTADALETAVREAYQHEFDEVVPTPAIFNDVRAVDCKGKGHVTTTAYLKRGEYSHALLTMYLSRDGAQVIRRSLSYVMAPVGTFKTLVVIVGYPQTVTAEGVALFEKAQAQINDDHAALARKRGYQSPLVVFDNTNLIIEPSEIADPHDPSDVRAGRRTKRQLAGRSSTRDSDRP